MRIVTLAVVVVVAVAARSPTSAQELLLRAVPNSGLDLEQRSGGLGKEFITEAYFRNGKRADVLITDDAEAWEVLKSEKMSSILDKVDEYPVTVIPFRAEKVIALWMKKLGYVKKEEMM